MESRVGIALVDSNRLKDALAPSPDKCLAEVSYKIYTIICYIIIIEHSCYIIYWEILKYWFTIQISHFIPRLAYTKNEELLSQLTSAIQTLSSSPKTVCKQIYLIIKFRKFINIFSGGGIRRESQLLAWHTDERGWSQT